MEKFKQALIQFAHSNPNFPPNNNNSTLIEQRFSQFFPNFHTPNHPPYAAMIHRAIWELNKKGGSSEDSISKYIKKEYVDLPWAHSTLLKHHLDKLCDDKEICVNHKQRYSLVNGNGDGTDVVDEPVLSGTSHVSKLEKNSETCKKRKKMKSGVDLEKGKVGSGRKGRKRKRRERSVVDIEESDKQIIDVGNEQGLDVEPLNEVDDEREVDREVLSITDANDIGNQCVEIGNEVEANLIQNNDDEQDEMMENPQLLQLEQSPDSSQLVKKGKRIYTRSQIKELLKDEVVRLELVGPPSYIDLCKEKEHSTEIIEGKEAKQTPSPVSTQMNGQRAKLRSSQKNTVVESTDTEVLKVISSSLETQEAGGSEQDQQPDEQKDETQEDKPKKRGRKKSVQSAEKCKAGSRCSKRKRVDNERLGKLKSKTKKVQVKNKRHKMTRRSTRKKRK